MMTNVIFAPIVAGILNTMSFSHGPDSGLSLYLVEPSSVIAEALTTLLEDRVSSVQCFASAELLLGERSLLVPRRLLITELQLPGMSGIELMLELERKHLPTPTIIMTTEASISTAVSAIRHGAFDFVEKPCITAEILDDINLLEATWS